MRLFVLALTLLVTVPAVHAQNLIGEGLRLTRIAYLDSSFVYHVEIGGNARTVSYAAPRRGVGVIRVADKGGREILAIQRGPQRTITRVNGRPIRLRDGQSLYDVIGVDVEAVWLVEQNLGASRSVGVEWLREVAADANGGEPAPSTQGLWQVPGMWQDIIGGIVGGGGGGGRTSCSQSSTTCTEEDINGNTSTVTHRCACGVAFCSTQRFNVEVPVVVGHEDGTTEIRSEQREYTRCLCGCLKLEENRG